jgi:hypothetical protein
MDAVEGDIQYGVSSSLSMSKAVRRCVDMGLLQLVVERVIVSTGFASMPQVVAPLQPGRGSMSIDIQQGWRTHG